MSGTYSLEVVTRGGTETIHEISASDLSRLMDFDLVETSEDGTYWQFKEGNELCDLAVVLLSLGEDIDG